MLTYLLSLNQVKMILNTKTKLFKNRKVCSQLKAFITVLNYYYFFD